MHNILRVKAQTSTILISVSLGHETRFPMQD